MVNTITFGNVTSSTYDIYISGEGVWSAPERATEVIAIPGRNGAFIQDKGRYENITVTYPAFIVKDNNTDFKTKIDAFRNAMCAQIGYQKLTDTFHADEYRMAALIGGLEVEPILYNDHAATFDITFECKPQRYLLTGDSAVTVANNGTLTNPTLFDAKPLLEVKGYGDISINSDEINIENTELGWVTVLGKQYDAPFKTNYIIIVPKLNSMLNSGDLFRCEATRFITSLNRESGQSPIKEVQVTSSTNCSYTVSNNSIELDMVTAPFNYGTSGTFTATLNYTALFDDGTSYNSTQTATLSYNGIVQITLSVTDSESSSKYNVTGQLIVSPLVYGYSTKTGAGNPLYIDLDIGEAWNEDYTDPTPRNNAVYLPANLPTLKPGSNTITYDNTITSFKIVPRWWKV